MYVDVSVNVDPEDVLRELSDDELARILAKRQKEPLENPTLLLQRVYEQYRLRGDAIPDLREYIYQVLGRVL